MTKFTIDRGEDNLVTEFIPDENMPDTLATKIEELHSEEVISISMEFQEGVTVLDVQDLGDIDPTRIKSVKIKLK